MINTADETDGEEGGHGSGQLDGWVVSELTRSASGRTLYPRARMRIDASRRAGGAVSRARDTRAFRFAVHCRVSLSFVCKGRVSFRFGDHRMGLEDVRASTVRSRPVFDTARRAITHPPRKASMRHVHNNAHSLRPPVAVRAGHGPDVFVDEMSILTVASQPKLSDAFRRKHLRTETCCVSFRRAPFRASGGVASDDDRCTKRKCEYSICERCRIFLSYCTYFNLQCHFASLMSSAVPTVVQHLPRRMFFFPFHDTPARYFCSLHALGSVHF